MIELVIEEMPTAIRPATGREVISVCGPEEPVSVGAAVAMLDRALDALAAAEAGSLPVVVQAEVLRALGRAEARQTAARSRVLAAFTAQGGYEGDGQGSARVWLRWQTRVTKAAAAGAVGWARRLAAHPVIAAALAAGELSVSWARAICNWSERLPEASREDADRILAGAAARGAELADLAGLGQQMFERSRQHRPDEDDDDGFDDRGVALDLTFGGAGRLTGDLTAGCAEALAAVLEALGTPAGPEDMRTACQRRHDALAEACQRPIAARLLPGRAGQPAQAQVHITLAQLRALPGASEAEAAWRAAAARQHGWLAGPEAEAAGCDASVAPVVTGHLDPAALDRMGAVFAASHGLAAAHPGRPPAVPIPPAGRPAQPAGPTWSPASPQPAGPGLPAQPVGTGRTGTGQAGSCGCRCGGGTCPTPTPLPPATLARLRRSLLAMAADVLSGPGGLAAWLRTSTLAGGPSGSASLPLDVPIPLDTGQAEPAIPAHLRRAVTTRHPHCAFPGCDQPASTCHIHHLTPALTAAPPRCPTS